MPLSCRDRSCEAPGDGKSGALFKSPQLVKFVVIQFVQQGVDALAQFASGWPRPWSFRANAKARSSRGGKRCKRVGALRSSLS